MARAGGRVSAAERRDAGSGGRREQAGAAQGKLAEAANYYRQAINVIPLPEFAAALSDVYAAMGQTSDAQQQRQLVEFIARLNAFNRVLEDYYADHDAADERAVELAVTEFKV